MRHGGLLALAAIIGIASGCRLIERLSTSPILPRNREPPLPGPPTYSQYHLDGWRWEDVNRVLVLPPRNESQYTRAGEELHAALTSELQRLGRFEVVAAPPDPNGSLAKIIHTGGRFDEPELLDIAKATRADVILFPTITQYSPYPRPRMGLVIQAVSPQDGKVVASIDGLWDTTDSSIAEQVRTFYRQRDKPLPPRVRNHEIASDDAFASELSLDSPALFQRYVCHVGSRVLLGLPENYGVPMQAPRPIRLPRFGGFGHKPQGNCDGCEPGPSAPVAAAPGAPVRAESPAPMPTQPAIPPARNGGGEPTIPPVPLPDVETGPKN